MIPLFDYGPGRFHRGMDDFDQIEPLFLELQLVARNSTDVEQIIRQMREISHLSFDDILSPSRVMFGRGRRILQRADIADQRERVTKLMR